jgi:hypothetical protein
MLLRRFRKEALPAGFATEAQAPMVVANKTKFSPAVGTAVLRLAHDALPPIWRLIAPRPPGAGDWNGDRISSFRATATVLFGIAFRRRMPQAALPRRFGGINVLQYSQAPAFGAGGSRGRDIDRMAAGLCAKLPRPRQDRGQNAKTALLDSAVAN